MANSSADVTKSKSSHVKDMVSCEDMNFSQLEKTNPGNSVDFSTCNVLGVTVLLGF